MDEESLVFASASFAFVQYMPQRLKNGSVLVKTQGAFSAKLITVYGNSPPAKNVGQSMEGVHFSLLYGSAKNWKNRYYQIRKSCVGMHICATESYELTASVACFQLGQS